MINIQVRSLRTQCSHSYLEESIDLDGATNIPLASYRDSYANVVLTTPRGPPASPPLAYLTCLLCIPESAVEIKN